jgi:hypothetical protein
LRFGHQRNVKQPLFRIASLKVHRLPLFDTKKWNVKTNPTTLARRKRTANDGNAAGETWINSCIHALKSPVITWPFCSRTGRRRARISD